MDNSKNANQSEEEPSCGGEGETRYGSGGDPGGGRTANLIKRSVKTTQIRKKKGVGSPLSGKGIRVAGLLARGKERVGKEKRELSVAVFQKRK